MEAPPLLHLIHRSAWKVNSANFVLKLSEKGFEQRSEHGFGRYSGAKTGRKMPFGCLMRPRPGHLRDFSDSFLTGFSEVRIAPVQHLCASRSTTLLLTNKALRR